MDETPVLRVETAEELGPFLKAAQRKAWKEGYAAGAQDFDCSLSDPGTPNPYEGPYDPRADVPEPVVEPEAPVLRVDTSERDWRKEFGEFEAKLHDLMAEALGYPLYEPGEPGYSPDRPNYVTGDHTGYTLAMEAASKLKHERVRGLFTTKALAARIESYLKRATIPAPFPWVQPVGVTAMGLARAMLAEEDEPDPELPIGLCGNRADPEVAAINPKELIADASRMAWDEGAEWMRTHFGTYPETVRASNPYRSGGGADND